MSNSTDHRFPAVKPYFEIDPENWLQSDETADSEGEHPVYGCHVNVSIDPNFYASRDYTFALAYIWESPNLESYGQYLDPSNRCVISYRHTFFQLELKYSPPQVHWH
jgi:hypothetical protein